MSKAIPNIVVLTGAGISAESGLKTFRDSNGLWEDHRVEDVATPEAFVANPSLVYRFYNARRAQLQQELVQPNPAHRALALLAEKLGKHFTLITQNVDDLHERGGCHNAIHMHGELLSARCTASQQQFEWQNEFDDTTLCPCCSTTSLRPDIVWFGEVPMHMDTISHALSHADVFIAIGTSGHVYPAAGFVQMAKYAGAKTIEVNLEPSTNNHLFDEAITGLASQAVPALVTRLLNNYSLN